MRSSKKSFLYYFVLVLLICHPYTSFCQESPCSSSQCERLVNAYALAAFYPNEFAKYVQEECTALSDNNFHRYINTIADAFINLDFNQPDRNEIYERSMDVATRAGAPELGPRVADDMIQSQGNYAIIGMALKQLSEVLAGRLSYEETLLYQTAAQLQVTTQLWRLAGGEYEYAGFWDKYIDLLFNITRWYMGYMFSQIQY